MNIVPDHAEIDFEIRYLEGEPLTALEVELRAAAERVSLRYGHLGTEAIALDRLFAYPGLDTPPDGEAVALLADLLPGARRIKVSYGTEAGHFSAAGMPALVCGPGSMEQGHKPDEFIDMSELAACGTMLDRLLDSIAR